MNDAAAHPASPRRHHRLAPVLGMIALGFAVCVPVGWLRGGAAAALAAAAGMAAAALGGLAGWAVLRFKPPGKPGDSPAAAALPATGARLAVTAAAAAMFWAALDLDHRPMVLAALLGYLLLMAAEVALLYGSASTHPRPGA